MYKQIIQPVYPSKFWKGLKEKAVIATPLRGSQ